MYRVNSTANNLVNFQVIQNGESHLVQLLPHNFVFTERLTDQINNLVSQSVIRVHEVSNVASATSTATSTVKHTTGTAASVPKDSTVSTLDSAKVTDISTKK